MKSEAEALSPSLSQHSTKTNTATRPALQILGISSSPEMRTVILQTYLDNYKNISKNNSKHAFSNSCPLERYMYNSSCTMAYKFLDESLTETNWWKYLVENDGLLAPHQNINPLILWTTGKTILYPKYLTSALNQVWNGASNDLVYATASSTDCSRIRPKSDQRVCNKLTGTLTVASYQTVLRTRSCWSVSQDSEQCRTALNVTIHQLPRQLQQPDSGSFLNFWNKWLVSWNELPSKLTYITAKFGKENKFRNQVERSRNGLLSVGLDREQVHAYYEFPDFIMDDPR
jgi:hypothetical protein